MQVPPGVARRWLWSLAYYLERFACSKLAGKLYRKALVPAFRHNYDCGPSFNLIEKDGTFSAYWRECEIASGSIGFPVAKTRPGRPCLILGSGPSINEIDDRYFAECDLIATNGAIIKCAEMESSVRFYIVQDPNFICKNYDVFIEMFEKSERLALSSHVIAAIARRDPYLLKCRPVFLLERVNRSFCLPRLERDELSTWLNNQKALDVENSGSNNLIGWSRDPSYGVFTGSTVAYSALQLAAFMGYRTIFLGGIDFTSGDSGKRFYAEKGEGAVSHLEKNFLNHIKPSFELAVRILEIDGIDIKNLSKVSLLDDKLIEKI